MFALLPSAMPLLAAAVSSMDQLSLQAPPPMLEIGRRLRQVYGAAKADGYESLGASDLRKLPYACWVDGEPPLTETDPELVRRYWETDLPQALADGPRRSKRWLTPLFFVYCDAFDASSELFLAYSRRLAEALGKAQGVLAVRLIMMRDQHSFFQPATAPFRLADKLFADTALTMQLHMSELLLSPGFAATRFGSAIFAAALTRMDEASAKLEYVRRVFEWNKQLPASVVKSDLRVRFADALLKPWAQARASDEMKALLLNFFLREYRDPRIEKAREFYWEGVSDRAISVVLNWLAGDALRDFMAILQSTADEIWRFRQKFWMAYYDRGLIDEAWLVLGQGAAMQARRLKDAKKPMYYGELRGASFDQSVLLLKIGDLIFTEWSHNGSLRAYRETDKAAPKLYRPSYHAADLKVAESLDFHDGLNMKPQLSHMNSEGGHWQRKARDFIRRHVGVTLSDWEIL